MKRSRCGLLAGALMLVLLVSTACGAAQPAGGGSPAQAKASVKAFIAAYEAKSAKDYLATFDKDAVYTDLGRASIRNSGSMYVRDLSSAVAQAFQEPDFQFKVNSSFVSDDGRFAAIDGVYTDVGKDKKPASVPMVILLELRDGKIVHETDYYDGSPFE
jgi:ketosteroid isomerase-like protein